MRSPITVILLVATSALSGHTALAGPNVPDPQRVERLRQEAGEIAPQVRAARARLDASVRAYENARSELERINHRLAEAEEHYEDIRRRLGEAQDRLNQRANLLYRRGRVEFLDVILDVRSFGELVRALSLSRAVLEADHRLVLEVQALRTEAEEALEAVRHERDAQAGQVTALERRQSDLMAQMRRVAVLLERVQIDLGSELGKFRFPVRAPYSYVDTFGAPRPEHRTHQGIDIFAPMGTPVVAVAAGTLDRVGWQRLGGNRLWLNADDGHSYYYSHLQGFAPGMRDGRRVQPGDVLGYVGDTGNARGTPPHLHFEIHDPNGRVLNPYPTLKDAEHAWASI